MKIGDLVTLRDSKENEEVHIKKLVGKVGKVIDKQTTKCCFRTTTIMRTLANGVSKNFYPLDSYSHVL